MPPSVRSLLKGLLRQWAEPVGPRPLTAPPATLGAGPVYAAAWQRARRFASLPAVVVDEQTWSFLDLFEAAEQLSASLAMRGIGAGDVVALSMPNVVEHVIAFLALARLAATVALVSTKYGAAECAAIVAGVAPKAFLTVGGAGGLPDAAVGSARLDAVDAAKLGRPLRLLFPPPSAARAPSLRDVAVLKLTSGSTGVPKGVAMSAENVIAEARNVTVTLELGPRDRIVAPVPLFHSYGFDLGLLASLYSGAVLVLEESFVPRRTWRDLADERTTVFLGVPAMYRLLLEVPPEEAPSLAHVRYLLSCTAPLPEELIERFASRFDGAPLCQHYGSSESGAVANHVPAAVARRPGSVGRAMSGVAIFVEGEDGRRLGPGEEGEVVVESGVVALRYAMGGAEGASPLAPPRFRTGDLGVLDEEGFLFVRGRRDDVINVGGMKVYPLEVVRALETHPAVREAAVCGMRDASGEQAVYAVVALKAEATTAELVAHCRALLADYRVPRRIDLVAELPRGPTGKVKIVAPSPQRGVS